MNGMNKIRNANVAYHRNGICGEGFHIVTFGWTDDSRKARNMVAILFEDAGQCAVHDADETAKGNIAFAAGNSWRGDDFEPQIRKAVADYAAKRDAEWDAERAESLRVREAAGRAP